MSRRAYPADCMNLTKMHRIAFGSFASVALIAFIACGSADPTPEGPGIIATVEAMLRETAVAADAPLAERQRQVVRGPAYGQRLFVDNCSPCHSTGTDTKVGPGLGGIFERAQTRVPGLSAEEYITHSIQDPSAFIVESFSNVMPQSILDEDEIVGMIEYLKTLD